MDGLGFTRENVTRFMAWMVEKLSGERPTREELAIATKAAIKATQKQMLAFERTEKARYDAKKFQAWVIAHHGSRSAGVFRELMEGKQTKTPSSCTALTIATTPPSQCRVPVVVSSTTKSTPVKPARGISLYNHVCTAKLVHRTQPDFVFHPMLLVDTLCGAYARNGFKCVTLKQINPKVCCHVYQNGKVVACGAKEEIHALHAIYKIKYALEKEMGWPLDVTEYRVTNQVLSGALGIGLDLYATSVMLGESCSFDPEVFPGLHYFPLWPVTKPCILLYRSGKYCVVAMTGVHTLLRSAMIVATIPLFPVYHMSVSDADTREKVDPSTALYWSVAQLLGV